MENKEFKPRLDFSIRFKIDMSKKPDFDEVLKNATMEIRSRLMSEYSEFHNPHSLKEHELDQIFYNIEKEDERRKSYFKMKEIEDLDRDAMVELFLGWDNLFGDGHED